MKKTMLIGLLLSIVSAGAAEPLPPLRWAKRISPADAGSSFIADLSDSTFFYSRQIISKRDGSVLRTLPDLTIRNGAQTVDGGFVAVDGSRLSVLDHGLIVRWSQNIDSASLISAVQTNDGGYAAISGGDYRVKSLIKTDKNGAVQWRVNLNYRTLCERDSMVSISPGGIVAIDGGVAVYGMRMVTTQSWQDAWIARFDLSGSMKWKKFLGGVSIVDLVSTGPSLVLTGFLVEEGWRIADTVPPAARLPKSRYFPATCAPLMRIGADGALSLDIRYGNSGYDRGIAVGHENGICYQMCYSYKYPAWNSQAPAVNLVAVNEAGERLWTKTFQNTVPVNTTNYLIRAQPLGGGAFAVAVPDSLLFFADAAEVLHRRPNAVAVMPDRVDVLSEHPLTFGVMLRESAEVKAELYTVGGRQITSVNCGRQQAGMRRITFPVSGAGGTTAVRFICNGTSVTQIVPVKNYIK
jgi:hypothetical protein